MKFLSFCCVILSCMTLVLQGAEGTTFFLALNFQSMDEYSGLCDSRPRAEGPEDVSVSYNSTQDILGVLNRLKNRPCDSYKIFIESSSMAAARHVACSGIEGARVSASACTNNIEVSLEQALKRVKKTGVRKAGGQQRGGLAYTIAQIFKPKKNKKDSNK